MLDGGPGCLELCAQQCDSFPGQSHAGWWAWMSGAMCPAMVHLSWAESCWMVGMDVWSLKLCAQQWAHSLRHCTFTAPFLSGCFLCLSPKLSLVPLCTVSFFFRVSSSYLYVQLRVVQPRHHLRSHLEEAQGLRPSSVGGLYRGQEVIMSSAVCSGSPHSHTALSVRPHFFMDALKQPTPVRRRFRRVHCRRGRSSPSAPSQGVMV